MGIEFTSVFRERYYKSEMPHCKRIGVIPLDYKTLKLRSDKLNQSNFSSEIWFRNLISKLDLKAVVKCNYPILNRYFADFFIERISLVIEIDGRSHDESKAYDDKRDSYFRQRGLRVIRIKSYDHSKAKEVILELLNSKGRLKRRQKIDPNAKAKLKAMARMNSLKSKRDKEKKMNEMMLNALKK